MELTQEYVKALFVYKDGFLYWKVKKSANAKVGSLAGCIRKPSGRKKKNKTTRVSICIDGKLYFRSRIIFLWHNGYLPPVVDHKNRNTLDDKIENLRPANLSLNNKNRKSAVGSSSQYLGVSWKAKINKWQARIKIGVESKYLGVYSSEIDAAVAYNNAAIIHHGEFANPNIIKNG